MNTISRLYSLTVCTKVGHVGGGGVGEGLGLCSEIKRDRNVTTTSVKAAAPARRWPNTTLRCSHQGPRRHPHPPLPTCPRQPGETKQNGKWEIAINKAIDYSGKNCSSPSTFSYVLAEILFSSGDKKPPRHIQAFLPTVSRLARAFRRGKLKCIFPP